MPATTQQQRDSSKLFSLGIQVSKAAAVTPQGGAANIFTIAGGRVLVTLFIGEVTGIFSATATNLKLTSTPTVGSAVDFATNLAAANFEVGAILIAEGDGTALIGTATGAGFAPALNALPFVLPTGTISLTSSGNNTTGATKWDIFYFPLDDGAYVVSA
jgi:hypothetical protein